MANNIVSAETEAQAQEPPKVLSITVSPESPVGNQPVNVIIDFSEPSSFMGDGILADGIGEIEGAGFSVTGISQEQVNENIYRWVVELTPNENYVEGKRIDLLLPAGNYMSTATNLIGEVEATAVINPQEDIPTNTEDSQMATNHILWHQGHVNPQYPNCGGCKEGSPPSSKHIAAEYQRGMYTLTNVIYPYTSQYNPSNLGPLKDCLDKVEPGDTVYMTLVPPMHRILDAAMFTYDTLEPGSMLGSLAGMELTLVSAIIDEDGNVTEVKNVSSKQTLPSATTEEDGTVSDPKQVFAYRAYASEFTEVGEWMAFGLKISKLPESGASLADIKAGLAVAVHALGFDSQIQMG